MHFSGQPSILRAVLSLLLNTMMLAMVVRTPGLAHAWCEAELRRIHRQAESLYPDAKPGIVFSQILMDLTGTTLCLLKIGSLTVSLAGRTEEGHL